MKRTIFLFCCMILGFSGLHSQNDSLKVYYYENFPYAYNEGGVLKGIEVDIIKEYTNWVKQKKGKTLNVVFKPYSEFSRFYTDVKNGGPGVIGLGSVTNTNEREKEVQFSPPYLENVAVMITSGSVPTIKTRNKEEVNEVLSKLNAVVVKQSSHIKYLEEIKKNYIPDLKITYTETQQKVLENIVSDNSVFAYVDIVAYWAFLKNNQGKFLKIQKQFSEPRDFMSFIMPRNSAHASHISEFFESGFGFTSTKVYRQILDKYLGHEIIESVEIK